eukprot:scaffold101595_cov63-Phaeocystis_antarctica.AAC.1
MGDLPAFALERPDLGVKEVPVWVAQGLWNPEAWLWHATARPPCPSEPATSATQVKVATTLSAAAQEKGVDCAKVTFTLDGGERVHLDFMPTIGAESYEAADR